jgi:hypothetical protein
MIFACASVALALMTSHAHADPADPAPEALTQSCVARQSLERAEIKAELRRRAGPIQAYSRMALRERYGDRLVRLGRLETIGADPNQMRPVSAWHEEWRGWDELYSEYLRVQGASIGAEWADLDAAARALEADDEARDSGVNVYLDHESAPEIDAIERAVARCLLDTECDRPALGARQSAILGGNPDYRAEWIAQAAAQTLQGRRQALGRLDRRLIQDAASVSFRHEPGVTRTGDREITLALGAGPLDAAARGTIAAYAASVWSTPRLALKIRWVGAPDDAFAFQIDPVIGDRPSTQVARRRITLVRGMRMHSIAHEIGHALGFRDRYYTIWHPERCAYLIESDPADLMSDDTQGARPTEREIAELDARYGQLAR